MRRAPALGLEGGGMGCVGKERERWWRGRSKAGKWKGAAAEKGGGYEDEGLGLGLGFEEGGGGLKKECMSKGGGGTWALGLGFGWWLFGEAIIRLN